MSKSSLPGLILPAFCARPGPSRYYGTVLAISTVLQACPLRPDFLSQENSMKALRAAVLLLALPLLSTGLLTKTAQAQNIVQDPGFESADSGGSAMVFGGVFIGDGAWLVTQGDV